MYYLMSPELYNSLSNVSGFTTLNGKTYQEHIVLILGKYLSKKIKKKILNSNNIEQALELINIPYSHQY